MNPAFFSSIVGMDNLDGKIEFDIKSISTAHVEHSRNWLVEQALQTDTEFFMWIDDDMQFPAHAVSQLFLHQRPIIGGLCFKRTPPFAPCIFMEDFKDLGPKHYKMIDEWSGGVQEIDGCGSAFLMVHRSVYESIPKPWYVSTPFVTVKNNVSVYSEDLHFCGEAKKAGIPIFCDTGLIIGHMGEMVVTDAQFAQFKQLHPEMRQQWEKTKFGDIDKNWKPVKYDKNIPPTKKKKRTRSKRRNK